jgi:hypothetical protein
MGFYKFGPAGGEVRQKTITSIDVTIALFFDGTSNNKANTDQHNAYIKLTNKQAAGTALTTDEQTALKNNVYKKNTAELSSYENDYSNVVRLYLNYKSNNQYQFAKYIEGIGTDDLKKDDSSGDGWGGGGDGILEKVQKACDSVAKQLQDIIKANSNTIIKSLTIDLFGFSRGAAAARNFVYEITRPEYSTSGDLGMIYYYPKYGYLGTCFNKYKIQLATQPVIRFVGLFDTVASYADGVFTPDSLSTNSPATDETPDQFKNDTAQLHLDTIADKARQIVQFTAADEHRGNFPLTTIEKAVAKKTGVTFSLPGVHSDIGGSYTDQITEKNIIILNRPENELIKEKERLKSEEWFKETELKIGLTNLGHGHILHSGNLYSERVVSNKYSFIPLHFMCKSAIDFTNGQNTLIPFDLEKIEMDKATAIENNKLLVRIKQRLYKQVFEKGAPLIFKYFSEVLKEHHQNFNDKNYSKECNDEIGDQEDLRLLRHGYLHWNANYNESIVAGVGTIHPFYPRLVNGVRKRFENKG